MRSLLIDKDYGTANAREIGLIWVSLSCDQRTPPLWTKAGHRDLPSVKRLRRRLPIGGMLKMLGTSSRAAANPNGRIRKQVAFQEKLPHSFV
jgi:hypothetical protein